MPRRPVCGTLLLHGQRDLLRVRCAAVRSGDGNGVGSGRGSGNVLLRGAATATSAPARRDSEQTREHNEDSRVHQDAPAPRPCAEYREEHQPQGREGKHRESTFIKLMAVWGNRFRQGRGRRSGG